MARSSLLPLKSLQTEIDIYSNKSALLLFWLLAQLEKSEKIGFSINEAARDLGISIGLIHRIVRQLEFEGLVVSRGLRTNKKFFIKKPKEIFIAWLNHYNIIRKTKSKGFTKVVIDSQTEQRLRIVPALHSAAKDIFNLKKSNLNSKEYYLLKWDSLAKVSAQLKILEMDRGYESLFIKPYYSALVEKFNQDPSNNIWKKSYLILTILDLCHFPIRGMEQAEALFRKSDLSLICDWEEVENAVK